MSKITFNSWARFQPQDLRTSIQSNGKIDIKAYVQLAYKIQI